MPKQTFEDAMKALESIVEELEDKDLTLDQALKKFQQGMKLSAFCSKKLDETEKKVSQLIETDSGTIQEKPMTGNDVAGDEGNG